MFFCVGNTNCLLFHSWQQVSVFGGHDLGVFLESSWAGWWESRVLPVVQPLRLKSALKLQ